MPSKITKFLDTHNVRYKTIVHSATYTAQETAEIVHIKGQELAKTVIVKLDDEMIMAVVPASRQVDLAALRALSGAKSARLAIEEEFRSHFPECDTGAMPPFGNLYGMPVFVDEALTKDKEIAFNAGNYNELIQMKYEDFATLVHPQVVTRFALADAV
ncbi:MAG TPA: YbaK/EbsC family protein [Bryobacteraceae bacterium]|jgi:Ala-tRNA(Pro) deacylase